jgi:formylglycine-generating enzyme required for sulfatase activity
LKNMLVGDYNLSLCLPNYVTINKIITITEGQTAQVNEKFVNSKFISTNSNGKSIIDTSVIKNSDGQFYTENLNGVSFEMIAVQGGTFKMGSLIGEPNEKPEHSVTVNNFYIGKHEVTQAIWEAIMGENPSSFKGVNLPVENISWIDIQRFMQKINEKTGKIYRLPTEAEWEYAAKGGKKSQGFKYAGSNDIDDVAWCNINSGKTTHPVGEKKSNELSLYDMSGNVWEWCSDVFANYTNKSQLNPVGSLNGSSRINRGGSWMSIDKDCRTICRNNDTQSIHFRIIGFRLLLQK